MPSTVLDDGTLAWTAAPGARIARVPGRRGEPAVEVTVAAGTGPAVVATATLGPPRDLSATTELRFRARGSAAADGSPRRPFLVELGYTDGADPAGAEHRWLVPVDEPGRWEQHRIGLGGDLRTAVTTLIIRAAGAGPARIAIGGLLAVTPDPVADVDDALAELVTRRAGRPGPAVTTAAATATGTTTIVTALEPRLHGGNRLVADLAPPVIVDIAAASHDPGTARTTLTLARPVTAAIPVGTVLTVVAPVVRDAAPVPGSPPQAAPPDPAVLLALTDHHVDLARAWSVPQRDSFRLRAGRTSCSVRPAPVPVTLEYQLTVAATDPGQRAAVAAALLPVVGPATTLPVAGVDLPLTPGVAAMREDRDPAPLAPLVVRVDVCVETGPRVEAAWISTATVATGGLTAPGTVTSTEPADEFIVVVP